MNRTLFHTLCALLAALCAVLLVAVALGAPARPTLTTTGAGLVVGPHGSPWVVVTTARHPALWVGPGGGVVDARPGERVRLLLWPSDEAWEERVGWTVYVPGVGR